MLIWADASSGVSEFSGTSRSPFEFLGRNFTATGNSSANILASDRSILVDYSFYLPRLDKIYLSRSGDFQLIKGGGGALTREKIIAGVSKKFVCIIDDSKYVDILGKFPLPIEVILMARSFVAREVVKKNGMPEWRENFFTDNNNIILDVHGFDIMEPIKLENELNRIPGVVTVGIFANRPADIVLMGSDGGVEIL